MNNLKAQLSPKWFFLVADAIFLSAAFGTAYFLLPYYGPLLNPNFARLYETGSAALLILALPLWLLLLDWGGMYADPAWTSYAEIARGMIQVSALGLSLLTLVVFGAKEQGISRLLVFSFGTLSFVALTAVRFLGKQYYGARRRAGHYVRNLLIVGSEQNIEAIQQVIQASDYLHDFQASRFLVRHATDSVELRNTLVKQPISEVIVVLNPQTEKLLDSFIATCAEMGKPLRLVAESVLQHREFASPALAPRPDFFFGLPSILLLRAERKAEYEFVKRLLDAVVSAILLIVLLPLFVAIGIAIKVSSPGPVFYRWHVLGKNNKEFVGYKFRTMVANADQMKMDLLKYNEMTGPVFKMEKDPRVTPVGRFLRKYSLDELPQLWNVLRGDMSLVGPRPPLKHEFERFEFWQARKLSVRPGITCLWQVSGRNEIKDFGEWARLDLEYIDKRSLRLDFEILARTAFAVLRGTGR